MHHGVLVVAMEARAAREKEGGEGAASVREEDSRSGNLRGIHILFILVCHKLLATLCAVRAAAL